MDLMRRYMEAHSLSTDWDAAGEAEAELLVNSLSMALPLEVQDMAYAQGLIPHVPGRKAEQP